MILFKQLITTAGTFWMYSVFCAFAVFFVIFVVPETKGRNLEDIAKLFIKKGDDLKLDTKEKSSNVLNGVKCEHCSTIVATISNGTNGIFAHESETTKL